MCDRKYAFIKWNVTPQNLIHLKYFDCYNWLERTLVIIYLYLEFSKCSNCSDWQRCIFTFTNHVCTDKNMRKIHLHEPVYPRFREVRDDSDLKYSNMSSWNKTNTRLLSGWLHDSQDYVIYSYQYLKIISRFVKSRVSGTMLTIPETKFWTSCMLKNERIRATDIIPP